MTLAIDLIKKHEGFRGMPYVDTEGYATIGYGTKLPLSKEEGERLLLSRMVENRRELKLLFKNYDALDETRRAVLQNMHYNLGYSGLLSFKKFRAAVDKGNYDLAAHEMLQSKWAVQVKGRATTLAALMQSGDAAIA